MTNKTENTNGKYRLVTKCRTCGTHIVIGLALDIEEIPEYGKPRKINYEVLPRFIKGAFRSAQSYINSTPSDTAGNKQSTTNDVICSQCWKILKLKE